MGSVYREAYAQAIQGRADAGTAGSGMGSAIAESTAGNSVAAVHPPTATPYGYMFDGNEVHSARFRSEGREPSAHTYKLWKEQGEGCPGCRNSVSGVFADIQGSLGYEST